MTKPRLPQSILLVGASSDIGNSIVEALSINLRELTLIGRNPILTKSYLESGINCNFIACDFEDEKSVQECLSYLQDFEGNFDLCIFASGMLPSENNELAIENTLSSLTINGEVNARFFLLLISKYLNKSDFKIVVLSSMAAVRPRLRNFAYGASKNYFDFLATGAAYKYKNSNIKIKVLRLGFVKTKMTVGFQPAPFAINLKTFRKKFLPIYRALWPFKKI